MHIFHKNVKLYSAFWKYALCLIVCTWSHYLAGRMCTPSKYVCYIARRLESIYCVWSVASICTLLIYVWWKRKLIHVSANLYVLSKNYPINYEFWRYMSPNTVFYTSEKGGVRYRFVHSRGIVFDRLYMIPLPCGTYVYSLEICTLLYPAVWKYLLCLIGSLYMHSIDLCVMEAKVDTPLN